MIAGVMSCRRILLLTSFAFVNISNQHLIASIVMHNVLNVHGTCGLKVFLDLFCVFIGKIMLRPSILVGAWC
jgi:hypothetical protein